MYQGQQFNLYGVRLGSGFCHFLNPSRNNRQSNLGSAVIIQQCYLTFEDQQRSEQKTHYITAAV